jgi:hypothetical protein
MILLLLLLVLLAPLRIDVDDVFTCGCDVSCGVSSALLDICRGNPREPSWLCDNSAVATGNLAYAQFETNALF